MPTWIKMLAKRLTLAQQYMLASLVILVAGMLGLGWWVSQQIEQGVVNRTGAETALYVTSFIDPYLQGRQPGTPLDPEQVRSLNQLVSSTAFGKEIVILKVWDTDGRILFSNDLTLINQVFPVKEELAASLHGLVTTDISDLSDPENVRERAIYHNLLEIYSPVLRSNSGDVVAVVEFYQTMNALNAETQRARTSTWLVMGLVTLFVYILLATIVQRGSDTIMRQQAELSQRVTQLYDLIALNEVLHERVRRAAARTVAGNEHFLRRIGAELHDGPAQDLSLALLRLDQIVDQGERERALDTANPQAAYEEVEAAQRSVRTALQEVRAISSGLGLPQLRQMTVSETLNRVVYVHQRRTGTQVAVDFRDLPEQAPLALKITLYRIIQEALSNAFRHAQGLGQAVRVCREKDGLRVEIADQGPGFTALPAANGSDEHLGVRGMRERVESLGGNFQVTSAPGQGTLVSAYLPLHTMDNDND